jgi:hypothetical protein
LLLWALIVGGIASLLVSLTEAVLTYRERLEYLDNHLKSVGAFTLPTLTNSAWAFDKEQIEVQLKGFAQLSGHHCRPPATEGGRGTAFRRGSTCRPIPWNAPFR